MCRGHNQLTVILSPSRVILNDTSCEYAKVRVKDLALGTNSAKNLQTEILRLRLRMTFRLGRLNLTQSKTGFTLLELLMAVVVINLVALGIFATLWFSKRISTTGGEREIAMSIVEAKMNALKQTGAKNLVVTGPRQSGAAASCISSTCEAVAGLSQGVVSTVITAPEEGNDQVKEAKVQVNWVDKKGIPKKEALATYLYDPS